MEEGKEEKEEEEGRRRRKRKRRREGKGGGTRMRKEEEEGREGQQAKQSPWKFVGITCIWRSFDEHHKYYFFLHSPRPSLSLPSPSPPPILFLLPQSFPLHTMSFISTHYEQILQWNRVQWSQFCYSTHSPGESLPSLLTTSVPTAAVQRKHRCNYTHCTSMWVWVCTTCTDILGFQTLGKRTRKRKAEMLVTWMRLLMLSGGLDGFTCIINMAYVYLLFYSLPFWSIFH